MSGKPKGISILVANRKLAGILMRSDLYEQLDPAYRERADELLTQESAGGISVEWRFGWAVGCNLYITFDYDKSYKDDEVGYVTYLKPRIEVAWSSTSRSCSSARASINLYSRVTDLACLIDSVLCEEPIHKINPAKKAENV